MDKRITLSQLRQFTDLMIEFGKIERVYHLPGQERRENDQEHTFMLAMLAWYLVDSNKLPLDHSKILKYALAHDVVEVHAGDTYIYSKDQEQLESKPEREANAAEKLKEEYPEFTELHEYMFGYMRREDAESKFVYALDKILPLLLIHADNGRSWKEHGVQLEMVIQNKTEKAAISPEIEPYFNDLIELLKSEEEKVFGVKGE